MSSLKIVKKSGRRWTKLSLVAAAMSPMVVFAQAQIVLPPSADPGVIQDRSRDTERRIIESTEPRTPAVPSINQDALPRRAAPAGSENVRFLVKRVEFTSSEFIDAAKLRELAATLEGREVSLADVQKLVDQVNAIYRERNIATAQAILPPQEITSGVIQIRLVEGRLGKFSLTGNDTTREDFVLARIGQKSGDLADVEELGQGLLFFNRIQDTQIRAELKPGDKFGETDVQLIMLEPPKNDLRVFTDNSGSEATGLYRFGAIYQNRSLLGFRDNLGLTATGAQGHRGVSGTYTFPVDAYGTRLGLSLAKDRTHIIDGPFEPLNITGDSVAGSAQLRHPLSFSNTHQVDGLFALKRRRTQSWIDGQLFQSTYISNLAAGLEGQWWDKDTMWNGSIEWSRGEAKLINDVVSKSFGVWKGTARRTQEFSGGLSVLTSASFQYTRDQNLTSSEQILIGGEGSVRGYHSGLFSGDKGVTATAEVHFPFGKPTESGSRIEGFMFVDYGAVQPFRPVGSTRSRDTLASTGVGVNFNISPTYQGRVTFAKPLRDRIQETRDYFVMFQLVAAVF